MSHREFVSVKPSQFAEYRAEGVRYAREKDGTKDRSKIEKRVFANGVVKLSNGIHGAVCRQNPILAQMDWVDIKTNTIIH